VRPVLLAGRVSRDAGDWQRRVALAERLGAAVITEQKVGAAFPSDHPQHVDGPWFRPTPTILDTLAAADVVLALDWLDLGGLLAQAWPDGNPTARIVSASLDAQSINGWSLNHQQLAPVDLPLHGTPDAVVAELLPRLPGAPRPPAFAPLPRTTTPRAGDDVLDLAALADALHRAFAGHRVSYLRLPLKWPGDRCRFAGPLDFIGCDGGGGIGSGPGMAVGGALALRGSGRLPVAVLGDGDLLMGGTALWTAANSGIPLLVVVANNRGYHNDVRHQELVARQRGRPLENAWKGQRIDAPQVDIPGFARAQGFASGPSVTDLAALDGTLRAAAERVADGDCVLVDVQVRV
jgi:thiamine pyrophosphate-dependent acetolactate synthase large subunit-like protein